MASILRFSDGAILPKDQHRRENDYHFFSINYVSRRVANEFMFISGYQYRLVHLQIAKRDYSKLFMLLKVLC